jgi:hypothetical protein
MNQRVVIAIRAQTPWPALKAALLQAGAQHVSEPSSYHSDVVVATLDSSVNAPDYLKAVSQLAGVRYAEMDAMSGNC